MDDSTPGRAKEGDHWDTSCKRSREVDRDDVVRNVKQRDILHVHVNRNQQQQEEAEAEAETASEEDFSPSTWCYSPIEDGARVGQISIGEMVKQMAAKSVDSKKLELELSSPTSFRLEIPHRERRALLNVIRCRLIGGGRKGKRWSAVDVDVDKCIPVTNELIKRWVIQKFGAEEIEVRDGSLIWNAVESPQDKQEPHSDFVDYESNFCHRYSLMISISDFALNHDRAYLDVLCKEKNTSIDALTVCKPLTKDEAVVSNCLQNGAPGRNEVQAPRPNLYIGGCPDNDHFGHNYISHRLRTGLSPVVVIEKCPPLMSPMWQDHSRMHTIAGMTIAVPGEDEPRRNKEREARRECRKRSMMAAEECSSDLGKPLVVV
jgi:hypothetical protein